MVNLSVWKQSLKFSLEINRKIIYWPLTIKICNLKNCKCKLIKWSQITFCVYFFKFLSEWKSLVSTNNSNYLYRMLLFIIKIFLHKNTFYVSNLGKKNTYTNGTLFVLYLIFFAIVNLFIISWLQTLRKIGFI